MNGSQIALLVIDAFVGLTAIGGGIALATGLEANRFPVELLKGVPFNNYLIPGLILAVVVGGSAAVAAVATVINPNVGGWLSALAGTVLIGQIAGEILFLKQPVSLTEVIYVAIGTTMVGLDRSSPSEPDRPRCRALHGPTAMCDRMNEQRPPLMRSGIAGLTFGGGLPVAVGAAVGLWAWHRRRRHTACGSTPASP